MPPVYPFDKLSGLAELARRHEGGAVDLSIGTPCDPPPPRSSRRSRPRRPSADTPLRSGSTELREAASGVDGAPVRRRTPSLGHRRLCRHEGVRRRVPHFLRLRTPATRHGALHPALAYPTYEMGAILAGCRAVPVRSRPDGSMDLSSISSEDAVPGAVSLGEQPRATPAVSSKTSAAAASWGRAQRRAGLLRRVLHRVHLGRPRAHDPRPWARRSRRRPFAVEAVESCWAPGRFLRRRSRTSSRYLAEAPPPRRFHGPRAGAARCARSPSADDAHVDRQRAIYLERLELVRRGAGRIRNPRRHSRRLLLSLGGRSRALRAGVPRERSAWALTSVARGTRRRARHPG